MLTYDYECERCQRTFEVRQRISDPSLTACQFCGGPVHRLLAPAPFILKGGGWHGTDYPSEARKKGLESEKKASEPAAASTPASASGTSTASTAAPSSTGSGSSTASTAAPSSTDSGSTTS